MKQKFDGGVNEVITTDSANIIFSNSSADTALAEVSNYSNRSSENVRNSYTASEILKK